MSKITDFSKTISALATALGSGSIAVIRVSGKNTIPVVNKIFKGKDLRRLASNTVHFGRIQGKEYQIDQVLVSLFRAPASYTGEDYIEISCHGSPFIVKQIMTELFAAGVEQAKPGEFTLRAFLNGKMDLLQAEAVSSVIRAKSDAAIKNSVQHLEGMFSKRIMEMRQTLIDVISGLEIDLDFSEEGLETISSQKMVSDLIQIQQSVTHLAGSYNYAKILESGIRMAIVGSPNVGKSTLMNTLLGEERAITSHIPGTTRDTIHENITIDNIFIQMIDTAGLRETAGHIEKEGITRTREQAKKADVVLMLVDISKNMDSRSLGELVQTIHSINGNTIIVGNKADRGRNKQLLSSLAKRQIKPVFISAKTGDGVDGLKQKIVDLISRGYKKYADEIVISSLRQKTALEKLEQHIIKAIEGLNKALGFEFVAVDLREALNTLGELTGEIATDDILNNIFAKFCIGK